MAIIGRADNVNISLLFQNNTLNIGSYRFQGQNNNNNFRKKIKRKKKN